MDHDDGSNGWLTTRNVNLGGGVKTYMGYNKTSADNLYVYTDGDIGPAAPGAVGGRAPKLQPWVDARYWARKYGAPPPVADADSPYPFCITANGDAPLPLERRNVYTRNTCISGTGLYQVRRRTGRGEGEASAR